MPPVLIAAGVTAAASIGGAVLSSSSNKKAASQAAATAQQTTDSNNALAANIYGQNKENLAPFVSRGNVAGDQINALLGLAPQQQPQLQPQPQFMGTQNALSSGGYSGSGAYETSNGMMVPRRMFASPDSFDAMQDPMMSNMQYGQPQPVPGVVTAPMASTAPAGDAFNNFLNSSGFQFQMDQGNKATNQGYAARGMLQSGAALKALQDRGQQTALNNYFLPYMNLLGQQQGVGLSGASAVAGVGQNYAGSVMASNSTNAQAQMDAIAAKAAAPEHCTTRKTEEHLMAVQQNKKSPSKRGMHRAHNALAKPGLAIEPTTGETHLRHHISPSGYYRGKKVIATKD